MSTQWNASDAGPSDVNIAPSVDAASDASAIASDAGPTLIENSGFESAGSGCYPWKLSYSGTAVSDKPGHEGESCCRICATEDGAKLGLYTDGPKSLTAGTYRLSGWFRLVAGTASAFNMHVDVYEGGSWKGDIAASAPIDTAWTLVEGVGPLPANQDSSRLYVDIGEVPRDTCVQIDDLRFDPR